MRWKKIIITLLALVIVGGIATYIYIGVTSTEEEMQGLFVDRGEVGECGQLYNIPTYL